MNISNNHQQISPAAQLMAIEIISELLVSTSPQKLGEALTDHLRELTGAKTVMVLAHRSESAEDELLNVSPARRATLFSPTELNNFCHEITTSELPVTLEAFPADHPLHAQLLRAGVHSMMRFQLRAGGELVGLLLLFDLPGVERTAETSHIINLLTAPIALALKNALAFRLIEEQAEELEQRVAERTEELREAQALFKTAVSGSPFPIMIHDEDGQVLQLSQGWTVLSGYSLEDIPTLADWTELAYGEKTGSKKEYIDNLFEINTTVDNGEWKVTAKDGSIRIWDFQTTPLGKVSRGKRVLLSMATDITERKRAEDLLTKNRDLLANLARLVPGVIYQYRLYPDGRSAFPYSSPGINDIYEVTPEEVQEDATPVFGRLHPDDYNNVASSIQKSARTLQTFYCEFRVILPRQGLRWRWSQAQPERMPDGGTLWHGIISDITGRKLAEEEKAKLESQLQQAQKMESVGRLAGGVAHDFNNMLTVILGHAELGLMHLDPAHRVCVDLREISETAQRSADLTRQLLAFARKQTVAPKVIDLNETVTGMLKMLQRLIGEDIHLVWQPAAYLWLVKMDPSQIDQIMANLCVNARDAIEDVGRITIETINSTIDAEYCAANLEATPGEYVQLSVSDDGGGMDKETLVHIFEPFYTTKELGKGTGLGLATVYGAVKQNNGFINIYSEPGQGTTFTIYLPRFAWSESNQAVTEDDVAPIPCGQETILLVEDEPAILEIASLMLEKLGYTVLRAVTPGEAIHLARVYTGEIHMLMTDVIMPEMNGRDLAKSVLSLHPHIKCLFMSGYTADVIAHHGVLDEGVHFIQKPFSLPDMAAIVREVLDSI